MCQCKAPPRKPHAPLGRCQVVPFWTDYPQIFWAPSPESTQGNKYVLTVTDYFTKWVEIFAIPGQSAVIYARFILNEVIARFGCPYDIQSDQGPNYESAIFSELCHLLEIWKTRTTPGHPCYNGKVEWLNRTAAAYWVTPHESTGMTPNLLMFGREVRMPIEVILGLSKNPNQEEVTSYGDYVDTLREWLQQVHDIARKYLGNNAIQTQGALWCKVYTDWIQAWWPRMVCQRHKTIAPSSQVMGTNWRPISHTRQNKWPGLPHSVGCQRKTESNPPW